jgi:hypothetical protein
MQEHGARLRASMCVRGGSSCTSLMRMQICANTAVHTSRCKTLRSEHALRAANIQHELSCIVQGPGPRHCSVEQLVVKEAAVRGQVKDMDIAAMQIAAIIMLVSFVTTQARDTGCGCMCCDPAGRCTLHLHRSPVSSAPAAAWQDAIPAKRHATSALTHAQQKPMQQDSSASLQLARHNTVHLSDRVDSAYNSRIHLTQY